MLNLKEWFISGCTLFGVFSLSPTPPPHPAQANIPIQSLVNEVSVGNIKGHVEVLANEIGPRDTPIAQSEAADYLAEQLKEFGYSVQRNPVDSSENVIAQISGDLNSNKIFVIGAHFDTVPNSPGADDNASAVAGMLEIARILKDIEPDFSIQFVGFALEEVGLVGSRQYAQSVTAQGYDLIGMISLEMIGFTSNQPNSQKPFFTIPSCLTVNEEGRTVGNFIAAIGNNNSVMLLETFHQAAARYVSNLPVITGEVTGNGSCFPHTRRSDHAPFWDEGYSALMITDTANFRNPNYHSPQDTLNTLNWDFARKVTQATLATAVISSTTSVAPFCPAIPYSFDINFEK